MSPTLAILLIGSLTAASCALVGTFLVLRRMALLGDAISHAVLPGIVLAFLVSGDRSTLAMLLGAGALGVITVLLVETLTRTRRMASDASMGVVFPALFAVGVILVTRFTSSVDLDLDCVLYGEIAYAPWDTLELGGRTLGPRGLWVGGAVLLFDLALVVGLFKELKLSTFDPALAATLGFSPVLLHYLLMCAVSLTVVGSFEQVGAILVVAMLIVPPATAYLLTDRLGWMLGLSVLIGVASATGGYGLARWWDSSIAGAIAVAAGVFFVLALLLSPRHGVLARWLHRRRLALVLAGQLLMMHLDHEHTIQPDASLRRRFGWSRRRLGRVVAGLQAAGWLHADGQGIRLTDSGVRAVQEAGGSDLGHVG